MEPIEAALLLTIWYVFPILYVSLSKKGGQWFPIKNSSCPFGPKTGWLIIIIFLGAIGLILFETANHSRKSQYSDRKTKKN